MTAYAIRLILWALEDALPDVASDVLKMVAAYATDEFGAIPGFVCGGEHNHESPPWFDLTVLTLEQKTAFFDALHPLITSMTLHHIRRISTRQNHYCGGTMWQDQIDDSTTDSEAAEVIDCEGYGSDECSMLEGPERPLVDADDLEFDVRALSSLVVLYYRDWVKDCGKYHDPSEGVFRCGQSILHVLEQHQRERPELVRIHCGGPLLLRNSHKKLQNDDHRDSDHMAIRVLAERQWFVTASTCTLLDLAHAWRRIKSHHFENNYELSGSGAVSREGNIFVLTIDFDHGS